MSSIAEHTEIGENGVILPLKQVGEQMIGIGQDGLGTELSGENHRLGVAIDTSGDISLSAEYNKTVTSGKYDYDTSSELKLSTDANENVARVTGSVSYENTELENGQWGLEKFSVGAGIGAFGSNADIKAAVAGEVVWTNGTTDAFLEATGEFGQDGSTINYEAGLRQDILQDINLLGKQADLQIEGGIKGHTHDDVQGMVGLNLKF